MKMPLIVRMLIRILSWLAGPLASVIGVLAVASSVQQIVPALALELN